MFGCVGVLADDFWSSRKLYHEKSFGQRHNILPGWACTNKSPRLGFYGCLVFAKKTTLIVWVIVQNQVLDARVGSVNHQRLFLLIPTLTEQEKVLPIGRLIAYKRLSLRRICWDKIPAIRRVPGYSTSACLIDWQAFYLWGFNKERSGWICRVNHVGKSIVTNANMSHHLHPKTPKGLPKPHVWWKDEQKPTFPLQVYPG